VYGIIKQSGGYIFADSPSGGGAKFSIYLPVHAAPAMPTAKSSPEKPAARAATPWGSGTILLVEDEDAVRSFGARALRSRGYTVIEAATGVDALEQVGDAIESIDLVVSDVVMPEMDGPTLLRELRARKPDLKVIFVSGYAEEAFRKNLPEGQQFDFLPKPFGLKQLIETVKGVMG